jgi:hypothetical protein
LTIALAAAAAATTLAAFWPGFLSYDSTQQLAQAVGTEPMSDWHPAALSLLWRALIRVTGSPASMLVLQVSAYWGLLASTAMLAARRWDTGWWSLGVLAAGLLPQTITIVGVVWKDIHLALALGLSALVAAWARTRRRPDRSAWGALAAGLLLVAYATLVRKNAIAAAPPLVVLLCFSTLRRPNWRAVGVSFVAVAAIVLGAQAVISAATQPVRTHMGAALMLDDIVALAGPADYHAAASDGQLVTRVERAQRECALKRITSNVYAQCYRIRGERPFDPVKDSGEIRQLWLQVVRDHPRGYLAQRLKVFDKLLFKTRDIVQQPPVFPNAQGITLANPRLADALKSYVVRVHQVTPLLFGGLPWLTVNLGMVVLGWRRKSLLLACMGASGALYLLAYFPTAPASDYRYVYWPALIGSTAVVLGVMRGAARPPATGMTEPRPTKSA